MLVLLIRHAIAADQDGEKYPDDTLRPLVPKGRRIHERVSRRLVKQGVRPDRVFSSPWKRAWQTARIVVDAAGLSKKARMPCQTLAEPPNLASLATELGEVGVDERLALVGHEPWMSQLASLLLTGQAAGLSVDFPKSGIMGIETERLEPGTGMLQFFWRP
jgi:phosphohistidine phosphatase